jgi:hypothetical protein
MNTEELFEAVKASLEKREMEFLSDAEKGTFQFVINGDSGHWPIRLVCESEPLCLQVYCRLPLKVPAEQKAEMALALHQVNMGIRFGSYYFNVENGSVGLQIPGVISEGGDIQQQISAWVGTAVCTFDENLRALTLIAGATKSSRQQLLKLVPKAKRSPQGSGPRLPKSRRPGLN